MQQCCAREVEFISPVRAWVLVGCVSSRCRSGDTSDTSWSGHWDPLTIVAVNLQIEIHTVTADNCFTN